MQQNAYTPCNATHLFFVNEHKVILPAPLKAVGVTVHHKEQTGYQCVGR